MMGAAVRASAAQAARVYAAVFALTWSVTAPLATGAPQGELDDLAILKRASRGFTDVARRTLPAVVFVTTERVVGPGGGFGGPGGEEYGNPFGDEFLERFFGQRAPRARGRQYRLVGQGSGFLITRDGYILTNNHVVNEAEKITVKMQSGKEYAAKLVGSDPKSEVAVLKIDGEDFPFLPLGDSEAIEVGEWVIAIGNPFGLSESVTVGVVSAKGRSRVGIADYEDFIQTDAAINPGNSGGPLINIDGKVIGINTAIFSQSGGYMGIGFAIPISMAMSVYEQLVKSGRVIRGYLGVGIQDMTPDLAKSFGVAEAEEGVLVAEVEENSPASDAGLSQGDIIVELNGKKVEGVSAFRNAVAMTAPGSAVELKVIREGKPREVKVKVGNLEEARGGEVVSGGLLDRLGLQVGEVTEDVQRQLGLPAREGVVVTEVGEDSPAARVGIEPGDVITAVNRRKVEGMSGFQSALADSEKTGRVLLLVRNGRFSRFVVIPLK